jgi:diguanylate cyclase (GGDEF)-like protein
MGDRAAEYRKSAGDCVRIALSSSDSSVRSNLLAMALKWLDLAHEAAAAKVRRVGQPVFWARPSPKLLLNLWPARYVWLSLAAAGVGLLLSIAVWFAVWHREEQLAGLELNNRANTYALTLQFGINAYMRKVEELRALFDSAGEVRREEFNKFTKQLLSDQNAVVGMTWVPRVTREERGAHERAGIRDGLPDYGIRSVGPDGTIAPSPERSEYLPIFYTATDPPGSRVYGLDLNDGGSRQQTLERARDSDRIATSPSLTLQCGPVVDCAIDRNGFFVALPVYRPGLPHDTISDRRNNLVGYVQGVFQTSALLETIIRTTTKPSGLDLYFFPPDNSLNGAAPIYFHPSRTRTAPMAPQSRSELTVDRHWSGTLNVGDVNWTMIAVPVAGGQVTAGHAGSRAVLIGGLLASLLLMVLVSVTAQRTQRLRTANMELDQTLNTLSGVNEQLSAQNLRTDAVINNMEQGFLMFDAAERLVVCNERYIEMYGLSREIVKPGCSFVELARHRIEKGRLEVDPDQHRAELLAELARGKTVSLISLTADGREISITHKPIPGGGWLVIHEDMTERRQAEARIAYMAQHDGLTDLPNRNSLQTKIDDRFARIGEGQRFALLCLDIDHFKSVNDTLGHQFGDRLLRQVAARLSGCVHEEDTVARIGGDEFAVLQSSLGELDETMSLAAKIIEAISVPFDLDGDQLMIGASIGIAIAPTDAADTVHLLKAADLALCRAKEDRGTFRFFEATMDERMQARRALELDMRKALANEEFVLHYQSLVNLATGRVSGAGWFTRSTSSRPPKKRPSSCQLGNGF